MKWRNFRRPLRRFQYSIPIHFNENWTSKPLSFENFSLKVYSVINKWWVSEVIVQGAGCYKTDDLGSFKMVIQESRNYDDQPILWDFHHSGPKCYRILTWFNSHLNPYPIQSKLDPHPDVASSIPLYLGAY